MTPTPEQIREGRDEALVHLGIRPFAFDGMSTAEQIRVAHRLSETPLGWYAALTVEQAMEELAESISERLSWTPRIVLRHIFGPPSERQTDYVLAN